MHYLRMENTYKVFRGVPVNALYSGLAVPVVASGMTATILSDSPSRLFVFVRHALVPLGHWTSSVS